MWSSKELLLDTLQSNNGEDRFEDLSKDINFEKFTTSRAGAIIVSNEKEGEIPIIRTTTSYKEPSQPFLQVHYDLVQEIKNVTKNFNINFNNGMVEIYGSEYTNMKFHSDQALDFVPGSYICLFSCYKNKLEQYPRTLVIKDKISKEITELTLEQNSIILFSTFDNEKFLHKIVSLNKKTRTVWLGITFRLSKTFIFFKNEIPYFVKNEKKLIFANDIDKMEFYKFKKLENDNIGFSYPEIFYTLSQH
ncbi:hypothetical protein HK099_000537 [Clydaea vesicula]|uniref:Uncharacterized protein n=1 Tax=Clydaea vesicula TaxID=447962 RepID=A0AAD5TWJ5_9FUNG|nr:hypothetical protein HK099_000537 [Clydaea vesicula]